MNRPGMNQLLSQLPGVNRLLGQVKEQLGWQGISGVILLLVAGAFSTLSLNPLEEETVLVRTKLEAARPKPAGEGPFGSGDRQQDLARFFESLPDEKAVTDTLASIYTVAGAAGVELKQAQYHLNDQAWPRIEYGMSFPAKGDYTRIRVFVARVLADNPALALDHINFPRDKIDEPVVRAEIKLTLFLTPLGRAAATPAGQR